MKRFFTLLLCMMLALGLAGCVSTASTPKESVCAGMMEQLLEASEGMVCDKVVTYADKDYATYFEYWYDMPLQFVSDGAICYVDAGDNVDEISILKPLSEVTYDTVKTALSGKPERQAKRFEGLVDGQAERMEQAQLVESGGYLLFIMADEPQPVIDAFMAMTE